MSAPGKKPLILFLIIIFAGAMALGPLLYFALDGFITFHRAMDRALLICAVGALALFRSSFPLRAFWPFETASWRQYLFGLAAALVSAQAMIGLNLAFVGFTSSDLALPDLVGRIFVALAAAVVVPLLEETLFRGFLQTELIARLGRRSGWILAAAIYALTHFLVIPSGYDHQPVHPWSGIGAVGAAFVNAFQGPFLSCKGLNIFFFGLILGGTFLRSGTLWFNAGLHGGWVFIFLLFVGLTQPLDSPPVPWLAGDLVSNPLTTVVLMLLSLWLWMFYLPRSAMRGIGENAP